MLRGGGGRREEGAASDGTSVNTVVRRLKSTAWTVTRICWVDDVQEGLDFPQTEPLYH